MVCYQPCSAFACILTYIAGKVRTGRQVADTQIVRYTDPGCAGYPEGHSYCILHDLMDEGFSPRIFQRCQVRCSRVGYKLLGLGQMSTCMDL